MASEGAKLMQRMNEARLHSTRIQRLTEGQVELNAEKTEDIARLAREITQLLDSN